jgi:predicted flap endonuclease-1-like 5' DNA nuclease
MAFRMRWPTQYDGITQRFGENPQFYEKFGLPGHEGLDFAAPLGSEIYAVADGLVSDIRLDGSSNPLLKPYGNQVRIEHNGGFQTIYAHLSEVTVVRGEQVKAGQLIALSGNTGNSMGAHLHLSLKKLGATASGETTYPYDLVDPEPYLDDFTDDWGTTPEPPDEATLQVEVHSPAVGYLNVRAAPYTSSQRVGRVDHGTLLGSLEDPSVTRAKVGSDGQWLWVRIPDGTVGYVAAWYLKMPSDEVPFDPGTMVFVVVDSPDEALKLRAGPSTSFDVLDRLPHGTAVMALEDRDEVEDKVGHRGEWLKVQTADGEIGYCAAWYLQLVGEEEEEPVTVLFVVVDSPDEALKLRAGPSTSHDVLDRLPHGTALKALEDAETVRRKVGRHGEWIKVETPDGVVGYCAAWYLELKPFGDKPVIPEPDVEEPATHVLVESPELGLRLRAGPGTQYERIWWMDHETVLTSLEDPETTGRKVGKQGEWIHVRTPARYEGYAAAWYLRRPEQEDERQPARASEVPTGVSPHIFGIHAVTLADDPYARDRIRGLYEGTGKRGWIFFTETIGRHPHNIRLVPEIRRRLWDWADKGYGVIVRLNHGYEPGGTLPVAHYYDDFAATAARWASLYLKDPDRPSISYAWTVQIGNEQNNPREHPGGFEHPIEHITPERYTEAFNRTYAAIKRVVPNAIVCPGAVDPYNYMPWHQQDGRRWRPLDYFEEMMDNIESLDGVILHAYTHGPDVDLVTHLKRFGNGSGPLGDHYYDFQTYRLFMARVPAKWRSTPAYITEMNHIHRPAGEHDQGWVNQNIGWVRAVYAEIDRWNRQPYVQQIRCGLLYRWMWDAWSIEDKPKILEDFKQALDHDYRWRAAQPARPVAFSAASTVPMAHAEELEERYLVHPDDLTRIWGIGDITQAALNAAGVKIFEQLAAMTASELATLVGESGLHTRYLDTWPEQARLAAAGEWEGLMHYRQRLS